MYTQALPRPIFIYGPLADESEDFNDQDFDPPPYSPLSLVGDCDLNEISFSDGVDKNDGERSMVSLLSGDQIKYLFVYGIILGC